MTLLQVMMDLTSYLAIRAPTLSVVWVVMMSWLAVWVRLLRTEVTGAMKIR